MNDTQAARSIYICIRSHNARSPFLSARCRSLLNVPGASAQQALRDVAPGRGEHPTSAVRRRPEFLRRKARGWAVKAYWNRISRAACIITYIYKARARVCFASFASRR